MAERILVTGAGGFIGHHLVKYLVDRGYWVRGVDLKYPEYTPVDADEFELRDLRRWDECLQATRGVDQVYALAADMGGMGFIERFRIQCLRSILINTHMIEAARQRGVQRYLYTSSACIYPGYRQHSPDVTPLREADAYPADPEDGYGWEKLFSERMCRHFREDFGLQTRVARYHNVYGPQGTWTGGREKAPAAICRKVAEAKISGKHEIEIWGDGEQTRSFMYIDDCVHGSQMILAGDHAEPINLGSSELVSINQLYSIVEDIAGIRCKRNYQLDAPQGVRGRNSDNTLIQEVYGWEPSIPLAEGMARTYAWVYDQVKRSAG